MPSLTKFYGLTPMDIEQMTLSEVSEYLAQYKQYTDEIKRK